MADGGVTPDEVVDIIDISVDGAGVGRLADGCVVFVDSTVVGDRVRVRPLRRHKRLAFAELLGIESQSAERVISRCDLWRCGGCPNKGSSAALQLRLKAGRLAAALSRVGGIATDGVVLAPLSVGDGWAYRHRIRLHAAWRQEADGPGRFLLGYHERHTNALVPLSTCPVAWPELERLGRAIAGGVAQLPREAGLRSVELAYSRRDGRGSARIVADGPVGTFRQSLRWVEESELGGLEVQAGDGSFRWGNLELRYDHALADQFDLRFEPGLFTQSHVAANDVLVAEVLGAIAPSAGQSVLELHAGIGNFTLPVSRAGAHVVAVEMQKRAGIFLQNNARAAGVTPEVHVQRDADALRFLSRQPDVLLLDPPRAGARAVADAIASLGDAAPKKIVYVSCDPATFARDAARIAAGPRRLLRMRPIDLFPQTPHVECVAVFG